MRIYSSEPLEYSGNILKLPLRAEDLMDENVFENVFLPVGDYRDADIRRIVKPYLAE
ncbi:MAG: hypothetical protein GXY16_00300 [Syntrophomonadaceae bacterium]|nr:hypothetical protein [Syntrophomonadaceae bacterium]